MKPIENFKVGDEVVLFTEENFFGGTHPTWREGRHAVVHAVDPKGRAHCKYPTCTSGEGLPNGAVGIRFDNFDYGKSPSNWHTACPHVLILDGPGEDEVAEAIRSIQEAIKEAK